MPVDPFLHFSWVTSRYFGSSMTLVTVELNREHLACLLPSASY